MAAKKLVDYKQTDRRWKNKLYTVTGNKNQTMGKSGCGPTAAADVLANFCDPAITPWYVAQRFMSKGFRTRNNGTAWGAFKWVFNQFKGKGLRKFAAGKNMANMRKSLEQGALVICSMGAGLWTKGGHFIVVHKMDDRYVCALNPAGNKITKQEIDPFRKQCRRMFCFWPETGV